MSFPLVGNKRAKDTVESFISSGRFPHALIIEGELGTGRRTLAKYLAKTALCEEAAPPCNLCRNCHLSDADTHPDIQTVAPEDKKKNIAVGQIRELRTTAYHSPHTARRRVFIIEQAETMNPNSQNSLLKVLEEPPSDVIFILIATSANQLLDTVVSRCMTISLSPVTTQEALEVLRNRHNIKAENLEELVALEKNSIGRVLIRLKSKKEGRAAAIAGDYLKAVEEGDLLSALLSTVPLEKNRPEAAKFAEELSEILVAKIKSAGNMTHTAREYVKYHTALCDMIPTLNTNINLSLFFTALTSKIMAAKNE